MTPRSGTRRFSLVAALLLFGITAACECGDEGLSAYVPEVVEPDLENPRIENPTVRERDAWVDQFNQRNAALDILWVVDITASMSDHTERVGENFDSFVNVLTSLDVDFRLGVTSTDIARSGGTLIGTPPVLTPDDDVQASFIQRVSMDFETGAAQGLEAARRVVSAGADDFPREDAMLAVVMLTDSDDGSAGSTGFYTRFFQGAKGPGNEDLVRVSAIAGEVPDGCESPGYEGVWGAGASAARRIDEVVTATSGIFGSICAVDYGPMLDELGLESAGLRRVFPLSYPAEALSVTVFVDGIEIAMDQSTGWRYDVPTQSIRFDGSYIPPAGTVIHVRYRVRS